MKRTAADENETVELARSIAADIGPGEIILLRGDLGAGKTVLARALIRALAGDETLEVPSPTFTLVQCYDTAKGPAWHFDLYRLEKTEDIHEIGWEEALDGGIVIIEWPERLEGLLPAQYLDIRIAGVENKPSKRDITITRVG